MKGIALVASVLVVRLFFLWRKDRQDWNKEQ